jgi:hypothetical protein
MLVITCLGRFGGDEPSDTGVVLAVTEELQSAVVVCLVLPFAHETERRRRCACPADSHAEAVVEDAVRDRLTGVGYSSRAAEGVAVVELARHATSLGKAGDELGIDGLIVRSWCSTDRWHHS